LAINFACIYAMASFEPIGEIKKGDLEPEVQAKLQGVPNDQIITFYKGQ